MIPMLIYLIAGTGTWTAPDFIPPTRCRVVVPCGCVAKKRKTPNDELLIVESPYKKSHPNFDVHYERQKLYRYNTRDT